MVLRLALWGPLLIGALLAAAYIYLHDPFARDGTELLQVPLSEDDPSLDRVGDLQYLGGLDIPRMDQNIGGLSGLRWDAQSGRLLAITDDGRWVWIAPEENRGRLVGLEKVESGPLLNPDGIPFEGKEEGDSESIALTSQGDWLVAFERKHRVLNYHAGIAAPPLATKIDPVKIFGPLDDNRGLETLAAKGGFEIGCVERMASDVRPNCIISDGKGGNKPFFVHPPKVLADVNAAPTDADALLDGSEALVLFRSYTPAEGNTAAIVAYAPDGTRREIATFLPPLTLDNFEGLAVREEDGRTYLYLVSDDNFSGSQRTLLMKFELLQSE